MTRRQLIVLAAAGAAAAAGCASLPEEPTLPFSRAPVDAGPLARFSTTAVNAEFRDSHGFFVIHSAGRVFALSAICTHRHCKIDPADKGFVCPCHGAAFTADGVVTRGPARKDLPRLAVEADARGHLIVHADLPPLTADQLQSPQAFVAIR